jgi:hypothetical protein
MLSNLAAACGCPIFSIQIDTEFLDGRRQGLE